MKLTESERERLTDGVLKIESLRKSLKNIDQTKLPKKDELEDCLENVDDSFKEVLQDKSAK